MIQKKQNYGNLYQPKLFGELFTFSTLVKMCLLMASAIVYAFILIFESMSKQFLDFLNIRVIFELFTVFESVSTYLILFTIESAKNWKSF